MLLGEELQMQYKTKLAEEGEDLIPCRCGSGNCEGFIN